MTTTKRGTLSLPFKEKRGPEHPASETRIDLGTIDVLLPCRSFEVAYKVAELGIISPTLEFLLRLVKAVPGIDEAQIGEFFGYSLTDLNYVMSEALEPSYVERKSGRIWLTPAGQGLFRSETDEPKIFSVEVRQRVFGFDLISVAPQPPRKLDDVEQYLPELVIPEGAGTGTASQQVEKRFRTFFRQLVERDRKSKNNDVDLYSIDRVTPQNRFFAPVRIRAHATIEEPHSTEFDLSDWRDSNELADRKEVESAAGIFAKKFDTTATAANASSGYEMLVEFAPSHFRDFVTRNGLSVRRYWREAATKVGEARSDRKTIPIVGSLHIQANVERLLTLLDYGMRDRATKDQRIISVAPQLALWGATTEIRDLLTVFKRKLGEEDSEEPRATCLLAGRQSRLVERLFDDVVYYDSPLFPQSLEILVVPATVCAAVVHAPVGEAAGYPIALGFASFDRDIVGTVSDYVDGRRDRM